MSVPRTDWCTVHRCISGFPRDTYAMIGRMRSREGRMSRLLTSVTRSKAGTWFTKNVYTPLDKALYRLTKGRRGLSSPKVTLRLTTTGRKSGQQRSVPVLYLRDGSTFWVMGSNYAGANHPAWSYNLLANPNATVQIGKERHSVVARLGTDAEKARLWPRLIELYPSWKQYSEWSDRNFRLFALDTLD